MDLVLSAPDFQILKSNPGKLVCAGRVKGVSPVLPVGTVTLSPGPPAVVSYIQVWFLGVIFLLHQAAHPVASSVSLGVFQGPIPETASQAFFLFSFCTIKFLSGRTELNLTWKPLTKNVLKIKVYG